MRRLGPVFKAIVAGLSACSNEGPAGPDASSSDVADTSMAVDAGSGMDAVTEDAPALDSYVVWCEAGPPQLIFDGGCYEYLYSPCGLPPGDTVNDAGLINRCDQMCPTSDDCAELPALWTDLLLDAGWIDASTAATVEDGGAVLTLCACLSSGGRRPRGLRAPRVRGRTALGAYFSHMAHLERASVRAFERMREELESLGAPRSLVTAAMRASRDEERHGRMMDRVAARFGGSRVLPRYRKVRSTRTIEQMALENAVEGCVRETFGALVATWQAEHACDGGVRRTMERIAADEARHAELSWAVARFLHGKLDARARRRIARAQERALAKLHTEASAAPDPTLVLAAGVPATHVAQKLLQAFVSDSFR